MGPVEIRGAVDDDLPGVRSVYRRASCSNEGDRPLFERHPELLDLSDAAVRQGRTRVAVVDGQIVGFSSVLANGDSIELEDLFVDPDWMRRGVARALIADQVDRARVAGARQIEVDGNEHALEFYERVGFVAGATVTLEHGSAIRMTLPVR